LRGNELTDLAYGTHEANYVPFVFSFIFKVLGSYRPDSLTIMYYNYVFINKKVNKDTDRGRREIAIT
jgi:hypothetical protein